MTVGRHLTRERHERAHHRGDDAHARTGEADTLDDEKAGVVAKMRRAAPGSCMPKVVAQTPKVNEEVLKRPSSVNEYTMRNTMVMRTTMKIARFIRSPSGRSVEEFSGFDIPITLAGGGAT